MKKLKIFLNLREKLILVTSLVVLVAISMSSYFSLRHLSSNDKKMFIEKTFALTRELITMIEEIIDLGLGLGELKGLNQECQKLVDDIPFAKYCFITDMTGKVYYHNNETETNNFYRDETTQNVLRKKEAFVQKTFLESGESLYDFSVPIMTQNDELLGFIRLGILAFAIDKKIIELRKQQGVIGAISILFTIFILMIVSQLIILDPIKRLMDGIGRFGKGERDFKITLKTKDEFAQLADAFNDMTDDLKQTTVSKEFTDNILESMTDSLIVISPSGIIETVNKATTKLLRYKREEILGQHISGVLPDQKLFSSVINLDQMTTELKSADFVANYEIKGGRKIPMMIRYSIIRDKENNFKNVILIAQKVTDYKKSEEEVAHAYAEMNQIFNTAAGGMRVIDKNFNMIRFNETFLKITGADQEKDIAGKKCYEVFPGEHCHTPDCPLTRIMNGEKYISFISEKCRQDGNRTIFSQVIKPFYDLEGNVIGIIEDFRDITEQRNTEKEIIGAKEEIERRNVDLERFNKLAVDREIKMIELKKKIKALEKKLTEN